MYFHLLLLTLWLLIEICYLIFIAQYTLRNVFLPILNKQCKMKFERKFSQTAASSGRVWAVCGNIGLGIIEIHLYSKLQWLKCIILCHTYNYLSLIYDNCSHNQRWTWFWFWKSNHDFDSKSTSSEMMILILTRWKSNSYYSFKSANSNEEYIFHFLQDNNLQVPCIKITLLLHWSPLCLAGIVG